MKGRWPGSPEWLRSGWPRAVPLALLAVMPLALAGPIRFVTGVGSGFALVIGAVVSVLLTLPFVPALRASDLTRRQSLLSNGVVLVAGAFAVWILYNGDFDGLVSYVDPKGEMAIDAARHVQFFHAFTQRTPDVYQGFVAMYGFWDPLYRIAGDVVVPAQISYLFGGFVVAAVPCVIAFSVLRTVRENARAYVAGAVTSLVAVVIAQYVTILPNEVVHHMSGFWSHVFGLVPLFALWLIDTLVRQRLVRAAALLFGAVVYRYTYGLNLPDLLFALGVLLVVDAVPPSGWRTRAVLAALALAALAGAVFSYSQLVPVLRSWGWFVSHDTPRVWQGQVIALAALLASVCLSRRESASGSGIVRALRFPFLFGLANVVLFMVNKQFTTSKFYYFQKYTFHAVVLVASALVVALAYWAAILASRMDRRAIIGVLVVATLVAFSTLRVRRGFRNYQPAFAEYVHGGPYHRAQPWYDAAAVAKMHEVLRTTGRAYGGYFATFWPQRAFTNALFEFDEDFYGPPDFDETPGHCVFWEAGAFPRFDQDASKQCSSYEQRRSPGGRATLCWSCR